MGIPPGTCDSHADGQHRFTYRYADHGLRCDCGLLMQNQSPPQPSEFPRGTRMMFYQAAPPDGWHIVAGPFYTPVVGYGVNALPPAHILCEKD